MLHLTLNCVPGPAFIIVSRVTGWLSESCVPTTFLQPKLSVPAWKRKRSQRSARSLLIVPIYIHVYGCKVAKTAIRPEMAATYGTLSTLAQVTCSNIDTTIRLYDMEPLPPSPRPPNNFQNVWKVDGIVVVVVLNAPIVSSQPFQWCNLNDASCATHPLEQIIIVIPKSTRIPCSPVCKNNYYIGLLPSYFATLSQQPKVSKYYMGGTLLLLLYLVLTVPSHHDCCCWLAALSIGHCYHGLCTYLHLV